MQRYEQIKCRVCGDRLEKQVSGIYRCDYCGAEYERTDIEQYIKAIRQSIREEVNDALAEQRNRDIGAARQNLYAEIKAEHINSYNVIGCCRKLKEYLPEDFQANTFEILNSGSKKQINKCLDSIDEKGEDRYYIKDILDFMLRSLVTANVLSLKSLADRALNGKEKTEYISRIEEEAERYDQGMYNPAVPRDAFIAYSSKDMPRVNEVVNELKSARIKCYVALENLRHGRGAVENYGKMLEKAMHNCKSFVFMSSRNSRRFDCDAMSEELLYVQENEPKVKRIEYILDDYDSDESSGVKSILKNFFGSSEQCRDKDDLVRRIFNAKSQKQADDSDDLQKQIAEYKKKAEEVERRRKELEEEYKKKEEELKSKLAQQANTVNNETKTQSVPHEDMQALYDKAVEYYNAKDYENAVKLFKTLAEQGNADAQFNLGECYYFGYGVEQSYEEAVKWYRKAANQGHARAQCNLGICYYNGRGVEQSYEEAVKWFRKAANQGHARAQFNLGECYYFGYGVEQSYEEEVKWQRKAAEQGDAYAQCNLGYCYGNGRGVEQSYEEAVKWFRKAAEQGNTDAKRLLKQLGVKY